jgi:hypothetical protein
MVSFDLAADAAEAEIALDLLPQKEPVIHGQAGSAARRKALDTHRTIIQSLA